MVTRAAAVYDRQLKIIYNSNLKVLYYLFFIKERHAHAMECYFVTSRRCGALLQWVTQVSYNFYIQITDIKKKMITVIFFFTTSIF